MVVVYPLKEVKSCKTMLQVRLPGPRNNSSDRELDNSTPALHQPRRLDYTVSRMRGTLQPALSIRLSV